MTKSIPTRINIRLVSSMSSLWPLPMIGTSLLGFEAPLLLLLLPVLLLPACTITDCGWWFPPTSCVCTFLFNGVTSDGATPGTLIYRCTNTSSLSNSEEPHTIISVFRSQCTLEIMTHDTPLHTQLQIKFCYTVLISATRVTQKRGSEVTISHTILNASFSQWRRWL